MFNRYEVAMEYHAKGYNCAQSTVAAFEDVLPIPLAQAMDLTSPFGGGAGVGELCGGITGALLVLGLCMPVDHSDPVGSKKRTSAQAKVFQKRFKELFGYLRCHDLLRNPSKSNEQTPAALTMGITKHCDLMIVTSVEILEQMLQEQGILEVA